MPQATKAFAGEPPVPRPTARSLFDWFHAVRFQTQALTRSLSPEDMVSQSMADASPVKWHLAHTSWFFDTFFLARFDRGYQPFDVSFRSLFNSYYDAVGPQPARARRSQSHPTLLRVLAYREFVNDRVSSLLSRLDGNRPEAFDVLMLGLHHEQQHQELILTDIKHALSLTPLRQSFGAPPAPRGLGRERLHFFARPEELAWVGAGSGADFSFDNERPRHRVFLEGHALGSRLVTNGEYVEFIEDGGYQRPELWLSEGYQLVQREGLRAPLYWDARDGQRVSFTLAGDQPLDPHAPVCHVSLYEAEAYARWAGARLPTEAEWEQSAERAPLDGNFVESGWLTPAPAVSIGEGRGPVQLFGDVWEWTQSAYGPYPRYRPLSGALGEYNGKFMVNQYVLRGGSAFSPRSHLRPSYRNFFPASARWQLSGIRLAKDLS